MDSSVWEDYASATADLQIFIASWIFLPPPTLNITNAKTSSKKPLKHVLLIMIVTPV